MVRREELTLADRWIIARCDATVREATEAYERFRLNEAAGAVYRFLWSDLADWYIEQIKPRLYGDVPGGDVARAVAAQTFDVALRLLHPVMPFITETLWRRLPGRPAEASISVAPWPRPDARAEDPEALAEFGLVQQVVGAIRGIRAEYGVQPGQTVRAFVSRDGRATSPRSSASAARSSGSRSCPSSRWQRAPSGSAATRCCRTAPPSSSRWATRSTSARECERLGAEADAPRRAGRLAGEEARQRAVRRPRAGGGRRARAGEARDLAGAARRAAAKRERWDACAGAHA